MVAGGVEEGQSACLGELLEMAIPHGREVRPRYGSRGWPLGVEEREEALKKLSDGDIEGITRLWLRTPASKMKRQGVPLCSLTTGRGVRVIMLHSWPVDRTIRFGRTKPAGSLRRSYARNGAGRYKKGRAWFATFGQDEVRRFWVKSLLYASVRDHVFRRGHGLSDSGARSRRLTSFADDHASWFKWTR